MTVELPDDQARALRYFVSGAFAERRIAGRGVAPVVLAAHRTLTLALSDVGHETRGSSSLRGQLNVDDDLIGTATASLLLDCSERTIRRNAVKLGGLRPDGRNLVFRRSVVVAHARREAQPPHG